jgi:hypothetical protein
MTLCMAYTDGVTTWIAADTAQGNNRGWRWPSEAKKWQNMHGWMIAHSGDAVVSLAVDDASRGISPEDAALPQKVVEAIYAAYLARGFQPEDHKGDTPYYGSPLLLARAGEVYFGSPGNLAVATPARRWACIGCADEIAYGSLDALSAAGIAPVQAMRVTVDIAHRYYPIVDGYWSAVLTPVDTSEARH